MSDPLYSHEPVHAVHDHPHEEHAGEHTHLHAGLATRHSGHGHSHAAITPLSDPALATSAGIFAVKVSLVVLLVTAFFKLGVALRSGSADGHPALAGLQPFPAPAQCALHLWLWEGGRPGGCGHCSIDLFQRAGSV